ncbi:MAG: AAA family ATPase [Thermoguttaceae bacterium]|nr:AAA family ATPase [Thermoguttaceae bacterium]MDW8078257.1 AAA family ATPase [Thermoguttaceae bacterium]
MPSPTLSVPQEAESSPSDLECVSETQEAQAADRSPILGDLPGPLTRFPTSIGAEGSSASGTVTPEDFDPESDFVPIEPRSFEEAKLTETEVEGLILKFLLARGEATGRQIADQLKLPFILIERLLRTMKNDQLVAHRGAAPMNDYVFQLTEMGRERARRLVAHCSYFGAAPVALTDYVRAVHLQSLTRRVPSKEALEAAFADLVMGQGLLDRLGPAVCSGRGLFLYGAPGNGKTSIAERVTRAFGPTIWIPRALGVDGEIIRLFDPVIHEEVPLEEAPGLYDGRPIDRRWVRIRRPTIIAGGELTMASLEVTLASTGICEAPLQLKANCGTLVIDDFGRQRIPVAELLNRWIVPLEKRVDFLSLPNGKKITVPFDQLIIFSTNLEPRQLVDEAFLRRIPYKIEVPDPTEDDFRVLFRRVAGQLGLTCSDEAVEYLLEKHYRQTGRPMRFCHPRDLLLQVRNYCLYHALPLEVKPEYLDVAVATYFSVV